MIAFDILNSLARVIIALIVVYKLVRFPHMFNTIERYGMGLAAGCSLMTISVIWEYKSSPFEPWAALFFSVGICVYFIGRVSRLWRHEEAQRQQLRYFRDRAR